jgi:energy-coupling factor transport system ATP-binding protein
MLATHDVELAARCATSVVVLGDGEVVAAGTAREVLSGSLFAPQVLRVLPPFLTVAEVADARDRAAAR